jgi:pyruvate/2-oxoglutarate dehydrogenase complex dihydrolipoamide dehydrogenase (E3) component
MNRRQQADVVVIGLGPGGEEVAGKLAEAGLDVVGIERQLVGGECPYWGCVPSKMMIRAADLLEEARRIPGLAGESIVSPSWKPVARRIRDEATDDWDDQVAVDRFVGKGGRFVRGVGRLVAPGVVAVGEQEFEARRAVVLATGTTASIPPIPGLADLAYWTNREAIETLDVPESLIVLGGGAIGAELAQVFARFGARVTVVEGASRLLPMEEPEASEVLQRAFSSEGITQRTSAKASSVEQRGGAVLVELEDGSEVDGQRVLVATGRHADLAALGLGVIGIDDHQRWVPVNERMRVTDGVWAVGDLTGKGAFTHVAMYQAGIAVADILGHDDVSPADYTGLPRVTFTDPEVGSVGMTEQVARDAGLRVRVGLTDVASSARGWIHKAGNQGIIKLVEDADRGVLVGATSAGPVGGEVLSMLTLAVHARIATKTLSEMIYAYPTFHRAVQDALADLGSS